MPRPAGPASRCSSSCGRASSRRQLCRLGLAPRRRARQASRRAAPNPNPAGGGPTGDGHVDCCNLQAPTGSPRATATPPSPPVRPSPSSPLSRLHHPHGPRATASRRPSGCIPTATTTAPRLHHLLWSSSNRRSAAHCSSGQASGNHGSTPPPYFLLS
jgi:hypothetical protein